MNVLWISSHMYEWFCLLFHWDHIPLATSTHFKLGMEGLKGLKQEVCHEFWASLSYIMKTIEWNLVSKHKYIDLERVWWLWETFIIFLKISLFLLLCFKPNRIQLSVKQSFILSTLGCYWFMYFSCMPTTFYSILDNICFTFLQILICLEFL